MRGGGEWDSEAMRLLGLFALGSGVPGVLWGGVVGGHSGLGSGMGCPLPLSRQFPVPPPIPRMQGEPLRAPQLATPPPSTVHPSPSTALRAPPQPRPQHSSEEMEGDMGGHGGRVVFWWGGSSLCWQVLVPERC